VPGTKSITARPRRPPRRNDTLPSFGLALGMHALLFASISYVVHWNTQNPAPVVAELWVGSPAPTPAPVPVPVPPPPPPPPPPPKVETPPEPPKVKPDIVTEEEKKPPPKKEEPKVEEKKPPPKKEVPKKDLIAELMKKQQAQAKRQEAEARAEREAMRQAEAERITKQMDQAANAVLGPTPQPGTGTARTSDYITRLTALIKSRILYAVPEGTLPTVYADVQVDLLPTGEVAGIRFLKPSGLPEYDAAVERAIRRTDPFPRKPDGSIDRTIVIRFRPVETQE
jgi:colicin import membrane protein